MRAELQRDPNRCTPLGFRIPGGGRDAGSERGDATRRRGRSGGRDATRVLPLRRAGLPHLRAPRSRAARYGLALLLVAAAYAAAILLEAGTGKFTAFPFYAAVVAGAWLGVGPGLLSFVLSAVAAADFWTPARYS